MTRDTIMTKDTALRSAYQLQEALSTMLYRGGLDINDEILVVQTKISLWDCVDLIEKHYTQAPYQDEE